MANNNGEPLQEDSCDEAVATSYEIIHFGFYLLIFVSFSMIALSDRRNPSAKNKLTNVRRKFKRLLNSNFPLDYLSSTSPKWLSKSNNRAEQNCCFHITENVCNLISSSSTAYGSAIQAGAIPLLPCPSIRSEASNCMFRTISAASPVALIVKKIVKFVERKNQVLNLGRRVKNRRGQAAEMSDYKVEEDSVNSFQSVPRYI